MGESTIRDESYYQVGGWMLNHLGLKGTPLQVYAIIYGFSQDGEGKFDGSLQYLRDFTNSSKNTVLNALRELVESEYIRKTEGTVNGIKVCSYRANLDLVDALRRGGAKTEPVVQNLNQGGSETEPGVVQNLHRGGAKTEPNNKEDNKYTLSTKREKKSPMAPDYSGTNFSEEMKASIETWLKHRKEKHKSYTQTALDAEIEDIQKNVSQYGEAAVINLIKTHIKNGWVNLYYNKLEQVPKVSKAPSPEWGGRSEAKTTAMQSDVDDLEKLLASVGVRV